MTARRRSRSIQAAVLAAGLGLGVGSAGAAAQPGAGPARAGLEATAAWGTTTSAPAGSRAQLLGVTAGAPGEVWAVGGQNTGQAPTSQLTRPYAERWDGTTWTATPVPAPSVYPAASQLVQLEDAAYVGPSDVWAVGHVDNASSLASRTLAYRWNGTTWSRTPTPNPGGTTLGNRLVAVAARGSSDVYAVGESGYPARSLVVRWNGSAWSRVTTPDIGTLRAVAVSPTTVWVAGSTKIQSLTNGVWTQLPSVPAGSGTVSLSGLAYGATGLWAVGTDVIPYFEGYLYRPYAAVWNGTTWAKVTVPASAGLSAVTAAGPHVFATSANTVVRLTPTGATLEVTPALTSSFLSAITADTAGQPWAVGWAASGSTIQPVITNAPGINQGGLSVTTGFADASVTWIGPSNGSGRTTPFGTFQIGGIAVGTYTIVVSGQSCPPAVATATITAGRVTAVEARVTC